MQAVTGAQFNHLMLIAAEGAARGGPQALMPFSAEAAAAAAAAASERDFCTVLAAALPSAAGPLTAALVAAGARKAASRPELSVGSSATLPLPLMFWVWGLLLPFIAGVVFETFGVFTAASSSSSAARRATR